MKVLISISSGAALSDSEAQKRVSVECRAYINKLIRGLCVMFPLGHWLKQSEYTNSLVSSFDAFDRCIRFSTHGLDGSVADAQETLRNKSNPEFSVHDDRPLDSLVVHEFGHAVNHWIIENLKHGLSADDADELLSDWQMRKRERERELGYPSEYARKNSSEWFAERFAYEYLSKGVERRLISTILSYQKYDWWR